MLQLGAAELQRRLMLQLSLVVASDCGGCRGQTCLRRKVNMLQHVMIVCNTIIGTITASYSSACLSLTQAMLVQATFHFGSKKFNWQRLEKQMPMPVGLRCEVFCLGASECIWGMGKLWLAPPPEHTQRPCLWTGPHPSPIWALSCGL